MVNDLGSPTMGGQDHDAGPAQAVVDEIVSAGGAAVANSDTVATRTGAEAMVAAAISEFGQLDIVINNAGIIRNRAFLNIGEDDVLGDGSPAAERFGLDGGDLAAQMGPHQVAPAVVYLAHRSCRLNGETLSASGGRVARCFVGVTTGVFDEDLTIEVVADRIDSICDETAYIVPADVGAEMDLLLDFLSGQA